jgi:hypothetical protein
MRSEFWFHDMASLRAELDCFHVLDSAIGALRSDDDIERRHHGKNFHSFLTALGRTSGLTRVGPIRSRFRLLRKIPPAINARPKDENRDNSEFDNPNVGIKGCFECWLMCFQASQWAYAHAC